MMMIKQCIPQSITPKCKSNLALDDMHPAMFVVELLLLSIFSRNRYDFKFNTNKQTGGPTFNSAEPLTLSVYSSKQ